MSLPTTQNEAFISPEPFSPRVEKLYVAPGREIADILAEACNRGKLRLDDVDRVRVFVNGQELDYDTAVDYVTQVGDVINVTVMPLGGDRGGNKALQVVLTLAVIALSFWVGGPSGPLAAMEGLKGTVIRAAAAAAVNVGGSLAINALFRPDVDQLAPANDKRALQDQQNAYRPRANMPLVLGKRRVPFDLAARPYTQLIGDEVWLNVAFGVHYGPCVVEDIKIGETPLSAYPADEIQLEYFLTPGPRNSQLYPGRVIQENLQDELNLDPSEWEVHTTATNPDRIELDFTWPAGLRYNKDNGKILPQEIQLLVEQSPAGQNQWTPAPLPPAVDRLGQPLPPGSVYVQGRTQDPIRRTVGWDVNDKVQRDIRVRAWDPEGDNPEEVVQNTYWTALRTIERRKPIVDETLAVIVARIKSSEDLNGTLPLVSGVVTPIVPIWDGNNWDTQAPSSNAAALARWLVTGPAAAEPIDPSQIDQSCVDAYELIEERSWQGSIYLTNEASQEDALNALGRMGRFSTYWNGAKLCFVTDWEKPIARQLFSGTNVQGYRYRRTFPPPVHAVLVEFANAENDWLADELWVYHDGYDANNATLFETLRLDYSCTMDKAYRDGRVYLAKRELQVESHEWTAGADAIVSTYGDRVRVSHPSTLYGLGDAYVQMRRFTGGLVSGLRLDNPVKMEAGKNYSIDVRSGDFVLTGIALITEPGIQREIKFAVPLAENAAPRKGDLVVFGEVGLVTEDLEIIEFDPQGESSVTIRAQRYAAEGIMAAETGPIPPLNSGITPREEAPQPRIIRAEGNPDGVRVTFDINPMYQDQIAGFAARWRRSADTDAPAGAWQVLSTLPSTARQVITPPIPEAAVPPEDSDVDGQYRVDVEIRTIMRSDKYSRAATSYGILVSEFVPKPTNFTAVGTKRTAADNSSYPVIEVSCTPVVGGKIQDLVVELKEVGQPVSAYKSAGVPFPASNPFGDITGVLGDKSYDVRARWRTQDNWRSDWVVVQNVHVPANSLISSGVGNVLAPQIEEAIDLLDSLGEEGKEALKHLNSLVEDVRWTAEAIIAHIVRNSEDRGRFDGLLHTSAGEPIKNVLFTEIEQRISDTEAFNFKFDLMGSVGPNGNAFILNSATTWITPTMSLAEWNQVISSTFETQSSQISTNYTTLNNANQALAQELHLLGAKNAQGTAFVIDENTAILNSNGQSIAQRFQAVTSQIGQAQATAIQQSKTYVDTQSAFAQVLTMLSVNQNGFVATINQLMQTDTAYGAKFGLRLDVNGHVTGFTAMNNGIQGGFVFVADYFAVATPNGLKAPFQVAPDGTVYLTNTKITGDLVVDGAITGAKILGGAVSNQLAYEVATNQALTINVDVQDITFDYVSDGGRHLINVYGEAGSTGSNAIGAVVKLWCDGVIVGQGAIYCPGSWGGVGTSFPFMHTPGPGSHTYRVTYTMTPGSGTGKANRTMVVVTELKK